MVLVDTSVWVAHLREGRKHLAKLLNDGDIMCHSFVVGELACGNLKNRDEILTLLESLPLAPLAAHDEVLTFIKNNTLMGKGLGFIDIHLLASALLANVRIWTFDKKLMEVAKVMNIEYKE